jgi:hypothetical protein
VTGLISLVCAPAGRSSNEHTKAEIEHQVSQLHRLLTGLGDETVPGGPADLVWW